MKKVILIGMLVLLTGCSNGEEVTCTNNGQKEVYTLKDGMVESLTIDGEKQGSSVVDELNGTYFTSAADNEEAKSILNGYISSLGGSCK